MKQRVRTSIVLILLVIPIFLSPVYLKALLIGIAFIASLELNDLISEKKNPLLIISSFWFIIVFGLEYFTGDEKVVIAGIFLLLFAFIDLIHSEIKSNDIFLVYAVSLLLGFALSAIVYLYVLDITLVLFVLLVNYGSDVGAYLVGSQIGKHKLAPSISPNKTIEGSIGGVIFSLIIGIIFGSFLLGRHMSLIKVITVSLIIPIVAQLGDLFFSSLKRDFKKKDFGALFPGHGGVLDRIDSLIFSLLFINMFISLGFLGGFI